MKHINPLDLIKKQSFRHKYVCLKQAFSEELENLLENPDAYCRSNILKEDESFTTTVAKVSINNKDLVIKRYNIKSFTHALKRSIQPSRAVRCFHFGNLLTKLNINTPKPIAYIEKRFGPLRHTAYYITEYIDGPDGFHVFRDQPTDEEHIKKCAKLTLALLDQLKQQRLYHGDLKASNLIYHNDIPYLIDLDAMRYCASQQATQRQSAKDKKRFLQNWQGLKVLDYFTLP